MSSVPRRQKVGSTAADKINVVNYPRQKSKRRKAIDFAGPVRKARRSKDFLVVSKYS